MKSLRNTTLERILDKTEKFRRCFKPLQITNETPRKTLAGVIEEANELRRRKNHEQYVRQEDAELMNNGWMLLQNSRSSSDEYHMLKVLFVKSLGRKKFLNNKMGNTRSFPRVHHDFESTKSHGRLDAKKNIYVVNPM